MPDTNYSVAAWELARDPWVRYHGVRCSDGILPPWLHLWCKSENQQDSLISVLAQKSSIEENTNFNILTIEEVIKLHKILLDVGFSDEEQATSLFRGLPLDFVANLTGGNTVSTLILNRLHDLNSFDIEFQGHTPMYFLLSNACALRGSWGKRGGDLKQFRDIVIKRETRIIKHNR
mgnify:CR=1 FL=1